MDPPRGVEVGRTVDPVGGGEVEPGEVAENVSARVQPLHVGAVATTAANGAIEPSWKLITTSNSVVGLSIMYGQGW